VQRAGVDGVEVGLVVDERVQRRDAHDLRQDLDLLARDLGVVPGLVGHEPQRPLLGVGVAVLLLELEVAPERVLGRRGDVVEHRLPAHVGLGHVVVDELDRPPQAPEADRLGGCARSPSSASWCRRTAGR
jgi:hypothetical protein